MSDFVRQQGCVCTFAGNDSWVILSPIEQSIKRKIESVGVPLKDWDIQINYGIKTGFNDAFIITTEKREEILAACRNEDERTRTAELIRPIKELSTQHKYPICSPTAKHMLSSPRHPFLSKENRKIEPILFHIIFGL